MNRRDLLSGLFGVLTAGPAALALEPAAADEPMLALGDLAKIPAIPADFLGLSYESAQLANPRFFSAENKALIALFHEIAPAGNLRLGGGSSEFTTYSDEAPTSPPPFEVFGPDTSKTVKTGTVTSALALRNLRAFLDATGWICLYGLNLGQGTVENAVRAAAAVHKILGPRLLAFQIGNEPDSFRKRYRPETYTPADFLAEWNRFHDAIVKATPAARFAGPDISNKLPYLTAFAEEAPKHPDVILLTSHFYAMGPAGNPAATLENLLEPDPKLTLLKLRDIPIVQQARETAHLPYRVSEANSCWDGGKPGVSDTFASALWVASYLLTCMARGWSGVDLHGGGNGFYTPIAGSPSAGFTRRPEFFGIQFASQFLDARLRTVTLEGASPKVDAFAFNRSGQNQLVLINKTADAVHCRLPQGATAAASLRLRAPAIDAKDGTELVPLHDAASAFASAPAYTATVYTLSDAGTGSSASLHRAPSPWSL